MRFYLVDVFTPRPLAGNQLAVFLCDDSLDDEQMQAIARETNFSETTFVTGGSPAAGFNVRIFTPTRELPFAGHPTLGSAAVLRYHYQLVGADIALNLGVGVVRVTTDTDEDEPVYWLEGPPVTVEETVAVAEICLITGNAPEDIDSSFPVQRLNVGPVFTLVPFRSLHALDSMQLDVQAHQRHFGAAQLSEVYGVVRQARDKQHDMSVRLLFDAGGVREDAATGSAAVCLGAWILQNNYLGASEYALSVEQGGLIGRPSVLYLTGAATNDSADVKVGGQVAFVATGEWSAQ